VLCRVNRYTLVTVARSVCPRLSATRTESSGIYVYEAGVEAAPGGADPIAGGSRGFYYAARLRLRFGGSETTRYTWPSRSSLRVCFPFASTLAPVRFLRCCPERARQAAQRPFQNVSPANRSRRQRRHLRGRFRSLRLSFRLCAIQTTPPYPIRTQTAGNRLVEGSGSNP
jgi:hypothetical protein